MRAGSTLSRYFTMRFVKTILAIFALCLALITVIDYLELARRADAQTTAESIQVALVSLFRVPSVSEAVLPFATLFGSMAAFAIANRRLELVVARAAGVSAWQFLLPGAVVGLFIGVVATTVYNPLAAKLKERSLEIAASLDSGGVARDVQGKGQVVWFRQTGTDGDFIIRASEAIDNGHTLSGVTALVFGPDDRFRERIDSATARLVGYTWELRQATLTKSGQPPQALDVYRLNTTLSEAEVTQSLADPASVSFWTLPELIRVTEQSGLPTNRFRLQYHTLLARPLLLLAMVLIAGAVSFRFTRLGGLGGMILTGVVAGFVLYVVNDIAKDLGEGGVVPPAIAAWLPAVLASLASMTTLLRQEDG